MPSDSPRDRAGGERVPGVGAAVARFMLGTLLAVAVVVVGGFFALRAVTIHEAERDTRQQVLTEGALVEAAGLRDGVLRGKQSALDRLDTIVQSDVLNRASIVRVKVWSTDGTILYSDEPKLIGKHYGLGEEERALLRNGGAEAEVSNLDLPENKFERQEGKLLEAHTPIRTPNGTQVLFEIYQRFSSISASAERLLAALAPALIGGLLVLVAFQVPLAWSSARRLQRGHYERERLLASAIEASDQERRRIASDLHDGVVQDLAGVAFGLAPLAEDADRRGAHDDAGVLRGAMARLRQGVRDLRTLLVEIHPPNLESAGLEAALSDLLSPLEGRGLATDLQVEARAAGNAYDPLVYRVAREALRNVQAHSQAASVRVEVTSPAPGATRLLVTDDGRGFSPEERARRGAEGHLGLSLLSDLVAQAHGRLDIRSTPGQGTTVEFEVPAR